MQYDSQGRPCFPGGYLRQIPKPSGARRFAWWLADLLPKRRLTADEWYAAGCPPRRPKRYLTIPEYGTGLPCYFVNERDPA